VSWTPLSLALSGIRLGFGQNHLDRGPRVSESASTGPAAV
jgi:hypothetical protein